MIEEQYHYGLYTAEWLRLSGSGMSALMNTAFVNRRLRSGMRFFHDGLLILQQKQKQNPRHRDMKPLWELEFESAWVLRRINYGYDKGSKCKPLYRSWFSADSLMVATAREAAPMYLSHCWFKSIYLHLVLSKPFKASESVRKVAKRAAILDAKLERLKVFFPQAQCTESSMSGHPVDITMFNHVQLLALSYVVQLSSGWIIADAVGDNRGLAYFGVQLEYATQRASKALREGSDSITSIESPSYSSGEGDLPEYNIA